MTLTLSPGLKSEPLSGVPLTSFEEQATTEFGGLKPHCLLDSGFWGSAGEAGLGWPCSEVLVSSVTLSPGLTGHCSGCRAACLLTRVVGVLFPVWCQEEEEEGRERERERERERAVTAST
jgi:hypothetical protein